MNWVDVLIIIITVFYVWRGYHAGFISVIVELMGVIVSFIVALKYYTIGAHFVQNYTSVPHIVDNALGLVIIWLVVEVAYYLITPPIVKLLPSKIRKSQINRYLGAILSVAKGLITIAFLVILVVLLPVSGTLKADVHNSKIASFITDKIVYIENKIGSNLINGKQVKSLENSKIYGNGLNTNLPGISFP